ncbi:MAG: tetratricopeptide repeat protein [Syntrophaceae bacterium]
MQIRPGQIRIAVAAAAVVFLFSCAGGPVRTDPPHMTGGTQQIALGNSAYKQGCHNAALRSYYRAYELYSASDQPAGVAMSLNNLGNVYRALGEPANALKYFGEAGVLYARSGDRQGLRQVLANKAAALMDLGSLDLAEKALAEAGKVDLPDNAGFLPLIIDRGILLTRRGDFQAAEKILDAAVAKSPTDTTGAPDAAAAHYAMGRLKMETGQFKTAAGYFQAALKADQASGFYAGMADDLQRLGDAYSRMGEPDAALDYWKRSVRIYALTGQKQETGAVLQKLKAEAARTGASLDVVEAFVRNCREGRDPDRLCN